KDDGDHGRADGHTAVVVRHAHLDRVAAGGGERAGGAVARLRTNLERAVVVAVEAVGEWIVGAGRIGGRDGDGRGIARDHRSVVTDADDRRSHVVDDQREARGAGAALAVVARDGDGLALRRAVRGAEAPRPGAVAVIDHRAHRGGEGDRVVV